MAIIKKTIQNLKPGKQYLLTVKPKDGDLNVALDPTMAIRFTIPSDLTIPTELGNLVIVGNYKSIMISFNPANDSDLRGYNYQVYLSEDINIATPLLSGFSASNVITLDVPQNSETTNNIDANTGVTTTTTIEKLYFARVQAIDTSGNTSTWTPIVASSATTFIESAHIVDLTASKITAGIIGAHEIILAGTNSILKSSNYLAATTTTGGAGWKIDGAGGAVFNEASIRSKLDIGEDLGTTDATSFHVDVEGNMWSGANSTSYSIAPFRVANTGDITANSITLTGELELASVGTDNGKIFLGVGNYNNIDTGFYVDSDGFFSLKDKLTWDGTTLTIRGILKFPNGDDAGTFSDGDAITDGTIGGVSIDANKIYIGTGTYGASNTAFYVDNAGQFSLKDKLKWDGTTLSISGSVVITSGSTLDAINEAQDDANNAQSTANNAQNTANDAYNEAITKIGPGTLEARIGDSVTTISGGKIGTGTLHADRITAGSLSANQITGGTISASSSFIIGAGAEITSANNKFRVGSAGAVYVNSLVSSSGNIAIDPVGKYVNFISIGRLNVNSPVYAESYNNISDIRLKNDIKPLGNSLSFINQLNPVSFYLKTIQDDYDQLGSAIIDNVNKKKYIGFIAQDLKEIMDNSDFRSDQYSMWGQDDNSVQSIAYNDFVPMLVKAIQELSARIVELESR